MISDIDYHEHPDARYFLQILMFFKQCPFVVLSCPICTTACPSIFCMSNRAPIFCIALIIDASIGMTIAILSTIQPRLVLGVFLSNNQSSLHSSYFDDSKNDDDNIEASALCIVGPILTLTLIALSVIMVCTSIIGGKSSRNKDSIVDEMSYQTQTKARIIAAVAQQRIVVAVFGSFLALWALLDILLLPRSNFKTTPLLIHLGCCVLITAINASALLLSFCDEFVDGVVLSAIDQHKRISNHDSLQRRGHSLITPLLDNDDTDYEKKLRSHRQEEQEEAEEVVLIGERIQEELRDVQPGIDNDTEKYEESEGEKILEEKGWYDLLILAWPQRFWLAAACGCLLIRLPFSLAVPHFVASTLGAVIDENSDRARYYVLCLVVCGTIDALLDFWNYFLFGYAQQRLIKDLRLCLFRKILSQEISFFDASTSGDLTSRLTSDTSEMSNDLTWVFRFTIEAFVRIGGIAAYMFYSEWRLACVAVALVPLCAAIGKLYGNWLHENAKQVQTALAEANSTAVEAIGAVRTVVLCGCERAEQSRYSLAILRYFILNVRQTAMQAGYYMVVNTFLVNTALQASLLWYGAILVIKHGMHPQVLIAFMLYQGQLQEYTANLINSMSNLIKSSGAGAKVFELLEREPIKRAEGVLGEIESEEGAGGCKVEFKNVWFAYKSREDISILRGLNFIAEKGQTVALVGASGAGKSTVFHLLCRLYEPAQGLVEVDGEDVAAYSMGALRRKVAVVAQEPVLFAGTVLENILYGISKDISPKELLENRDTRSELEERVKRVSEMANALDFIERLPQGFRTEVGERGVQLSGGQKQRIAIARALLSEPSILLLDEATSALDTSSEALVQAALTRAAIGRTTLVIAHRLATIQNADKIIVMDKGEVVEMGTHAELLMRDYSNEVMGTRKGITYKQLASKQLN